jgi:2-C-methyl-D-erythritol 4-phosphate cytidylyltransferase
MPQGTTRDVGVVVVAAGQGVRAGGELPKQFRDIAGVPMLLRALRPFTGHADVGHVVVVLSPPDAAAPPRWLAALIGDALSVTAGGEERTDSVRAGLLALRPSCTTVLVHDAARPMVERVTVDAVITVARQGVGAVPAVPLGDTLKETDGNGDGRRVVRTISRERLWRAQTPQGFPRQVLERAHAAARAEGRRATDDAALVEALGVEVRIVPDSARNLKVTTAEDFEFVERLLARDPG